MSDGQLAKLEHQAQVIDDEGVYNWWDDLEDGVVERGYELVDVRLDEVGKKKKKRKAEFVLL